MSEPTNLEQVISGAVLRIRMRSPFFATLALFARFRPDPSIPTAATDGRDIFYNPEFLAGLPARQADGVVLHEVLHAALLHATRRGLRDPLVWNLASDCVVNGILAKQDFVDLIPGAVREPALEDKQVEEIYELLEKRKDLKLPCQCLRAGGGKGGKEEGKSGVRGPGGEEEGEGMDGALARVAELEAHWRNAMRQAEVVQRMSQGKFPAGMERLIKDLGEPQIDWRSQLWRFLVKTPTDFAGFDRRFVGRGLYLETLEGESVRIYVCIDTSGSVSEAQLAAFTGEILGILRAYPHLRAELFYADAALYGPYPLRPGDPIEGAKGGGGTSFRPFFQWLRENPPDTEAVAIYLTDGYGDFPKRVPGLPVLWVVTPGGLDSPNFPFGEVARLLKDS